MSSGVVALTLKQENQQTVSQATGSEQVIQLLQQNFKLEKVRSHITKQNFKQPTLHLWKPKEYYIHKHSRFFLKFLSWNHFISCNKYSSISCFSHLRIICIITQFCPLCRIVFHSSLYCVLSKHTAVQFNRWKRKMFRYLPVVPSNATQVSAY